MKSHILFILQPDPLMEALESLESLVGDSSSLDGRVETTQADFEVLYLNLAVNYVKEIFRHHFRIVCK